MYDELRELNDIIRRKQERIDELRSALTSMGSPLGVKVQSSSEDRISNLMCKLIIAENELDTLIDDFSDKKRKAQQEIFTLNRDECQDIMYLHYIEFKTMEEIARIKKTSIGAVKMKNNRAIKHLKRTLKKNS